MLNMFYYIFCFVKKKKKGNRTTDIYFLGITEVKLSLIKLVKFTLNIYILQKLPITHQ